MHKKYFSNLLLFLGVLTYSLSMLLHPLYHHAENTAANSGPAGCYTQSRSDHLAYAPADFSCPLCTGIFKAVDTPEQQAVFTACRQPENNTVPDFLYDPATCISYPPRGPPARS